MRWRLPLEIDGVDFSALANTYEYKQSRVERMGTNSGMMMDGTQTWDVVSYKTKITWPLNGMTSADMSRIAQATKKAEVSVLFFDTDLNETRRAVMHPTIGEAQIAFERFGTVYIRHGIALTLEEK